MGWKLTLGLLWDAWKTFPADHASIRTFPAAPPIFLTGTHRSGTTWVAQMLAESGLWYVHEPFNPNKGRWPISFSYRSPETRDPAVDAFVEEILSGGFRTALHHPRAVRAAAPLRWWPLRPPRVMIKDPLACLLTGYLARHYPFVTRVLYRHPAGFTSSILELGWPTGSFLRQFLETPSLMRDHLEPYHALLERHAHGHGLEAAAVLHGALTRVQWNQMQQNPSIRGIYFEALCRDPIAEFRQLFADLDLPYRPTTPARHEGLCYRGSPDGTYRTHAVTRTSLEMADRWRKRVPLDQQRIIRTIWEQFDIPAYREESDW